MNRVALFLPLTLLLTFSSFFLPAQNYRTIPYQAVFRDINGQLLTNQTVDAEFAIFEEVGSLNLVYLEVAALTTNDYGLVTHQIGTGNSSNDFTTINWGDHHHHLRVRVDLGNGQIELGTNRLEAVPYSLFAAVADEVRNLPDLGGDLSGPIGQGKVEALQGRPLSDQAPSSGQVLKWNGNEWIPAVDEIGVTPWTFSGSNIYRDSGLVSIGTNQSSNMLKVVQATGNNDVVSIEANSLGTNGALLNLAAPNVAAVNQRFISMQQLGNELASVQVDGQGNFQRVKVEQDLSTTGNLQPGVQYRNSLPLAYGSVSAIGNLNADYGVVTVSQNPSKPGEYEITLNVNVSGWPVVIATSFNGSPGVEVITYDPKITDPNKVQINISDENGIGINSAFSFVIYGSAQ